MSDDARFSAAAVPADLVQRPGLSALAYRVGTWSGFKQAMLRALAGAPPLDELGTRRDDDFTVALCDAWAASLDVLTFYQERIANEGFLRTAVEDRSLRELARLIGYEPRPGLAAGVALAFTVDDGPGAAAEVTVPAGTRAQSLPGPGGGLPQSFETSEALRARPEWNALTPRRVTPQVLTSATRTAWLRGTTSGLAPGDPMLLVAEGQTVLLEVSRVTLESAHDRTRVEMVAVSPAGSGDVIGGEGDVLIGLAETSSTSLTDARRRRAAPELRAFTEELKRAGKPGAEVIARLRHGRFDRRQLFGALEGLRRPAERTFAPATSSGGETFSLRASLGTETAGAPALYALRLATAPFGHNAPAYSTIHDDWRVSPYPSGSDWDKGAWPIDRGAYGAKHALNAIRLAQPFSQVRAGSWVVLRSSANAVEAYKVETAAEVSVVDFALSGRATRLTLAHAGDQSLSGTDYTDLGLRNALRTTTIYAASEELALAEVPVPTLGGGEAELVVEEIVPDLEAGRRLLLGGELADVPGAVDHEELVLAGALQDGGTTRLTLTQAVKNLYRRETVRVHANVAAATHGESRREVLGSGDAGRPFQSFTLREGPLTYTSAPVASGGESSLEVRVGGVRWREAEDFFHLGPDELAYVLRRDEEGRTRVLFGDGRHGARLPSGSENVVAAYRVGTGEEGLAAARSVSLLATRPLRVREVVNPLAAAGAEDPESAGRARDNAPLNVLTLDRVVSLSDFEDFARAFSGVGKAQARWLWNGSHRIVHLTVAGSNGEPLAEEVVKNLVRALDAARVPHQPIRVDAFDALSFEVRAALHLDPAFRRDKVSQAVAAALAAAFSFEARAFGQRVATSEVLAAVQAVPGVVSVNLERFSYVGLPEHLADENVPDELGLPSFGARFDPATGELRPAQLLLILPELTQLREESP